MSSYQVQYRPLMGRMWMTLDLFLDRKSAVVRMHDRVDAMVARGFERNDVARDFRVRAVERVAA
ncbi:hypothetical protein [Xanthomonas albilineans]|uniref:hypothetical protein n=1 Tax=Xanthomonas albilineans TaxID=29447 RepID=UPI0009BAC46F|nr:hypothetical protein [Xanthomonas albilineans]PPU91427.1 hypothetical protein XalbCFBP2523_14780 [Xanthomonas albilineans]